MICINFRLIVPITTYLTRNQEVFKHTYMTGVRRLFYSSVEPVAKSKNQMHVSCTRVLSVRWSLNRDVALFKRSINELDCGTSIEDDQHLLSVARFMRINWSIPRSDTVPFGHAAYVCPFASYILRSVKH